MTNSLNIEKLSSQAEAKGHNQSSIAKALGVSREIVSQWFKQEKYPRPDKLLKLARLLELSFADLVVKLPAPNEPVVAFRKKGAHKITPDYVEQAKDMGRILEALVPYLPFDDLAHPAILRKPVNEYDYVHRAAQRVREQIGVHEGDEIHFEKLIDFFGKLHAVLVPVLWGHKDKHENALHIHLPESQSTWIYLNLDCKLHDFKFWMSHELGHVLAPQLQGDEGEDFAEAFAGALLIPRDLAASEYEALLKLNNIGKQINRVKETADRLVVSPLTIFYEINKFAEAEGLARIDLDSDNEIHKATTNFNKSFKQVSEILFGTNEHLASRYVACAREAFDSSFFDLLRKFLKERRKSATFVQSILNIPFLDAQNVYEELLRAASKILIDTNVYFRLAQSIRPLLKVEFGEPNYCLYVIKELQKEYEKNPRLRNSFPWVNEPEYAENRSHRLQLSRKEQKEIDQAYDFIFDHARTAYPGVSKIDIMRLAHAYVLGIPIVTDDGDMLSLADDFEVKTLKTLDLLKLMLDCDHIDKTKVREIAGYLAYSNDKPRDFRRDYKGLFGEEPP